MADFENEEDLGFLFFNIKAYSFKAIRYVFMTDTVRCNVNPSHQTGTLLVNSVVRPKPDWPDPDSSQCTSNDIKFAVVVKSTYIRSYRTVHFEVFADYDPCILNNNYLKIWI